MAWLRTVSSGIWDLFVDDGLFALAIVIWLAAMGLLAKLGLPPFLIGVMLFVGLAALLFHSAVKRASEP